MEIIFEELQKKHLPFLKGFHDKIKEDFVSLKKPEQKNKIEEYFSNSNLHMILASENKKIIGYIAYNSDNPDCQIIGFGVIQNHRKKRIGSQLMNKCIEHLKSLSIERIIMKTWSSNIASQNMVKKFGFTEVKRIKSDRVNGDDSVYFELLL